jgi:hypothetical protein
VCGLRDEEGELFEFARLSMAEEATRFAVSLVRLQGADMRVANRPSVLDQCAQLLERHLGGEGAEVARYHLDLSPAAVRGPAKQVVHLRVSFATVT